MGKGSHIATKSEKERSPGIEVGKALRGDEKLVRMENFAQERLSMTEVENGSNQIRKTISEDFIINCGRFLCMLIIYCEWDKSLLKNKYTNEKES